MKEAFDEINNKMVMVAADTRLKRVKGRTTILTPKDKEHADAMKLKWVADAPKREARKLRAEHLEKFGITTEQIAELKKFLGL